MEISNLFTADGVVIWPLLGFSLLAVALIIERINFWARINNRQNKVVQEVLQLYHLDNVVGALDKLQKNDEAEVGNCKLVISNWD